MMSVSTAEEAGLPCILPRVTRLEGSNKRTFESTSAKGGTL